MSKKRGITKAELLIVILVVVNIIVSGVAIAYIAGLTTQMNKLASQISTTSSEISKTLNKVVELLGKPTPTPTPTPKPKKPIKVGVLMGLTGPWASIDGPAWNGIQLAAKQINEKGGLLGGRKIQLICIDTKGDEAETVAAAHRLVAENVCAVLGYCDTHWVLTAGPILQAAGIPFITPGATYPLIPKKCGAFLACFGDNVQAAAMAEYAYKDLGLRKVVVWQDIKCDFSVAVTTYFKDAFEHLGGKVLYIDTFETGDKDFSALIARLKAHPEADGVYVGAIPDNCGLIVKQIREAGLTIPILGEDGFDTSLLVQVAGKYAEGVVFTTHTSLESKDPKMVAFVKAYTEMFGHPPENAFAALGYDAMMLLAEAIRRAGSDSPLLITEALEHIQGFQGVTGTISFSPGHRVPTKSVALIVVKNGKFELLKMVMPSYVPPPEIAA